MSMELVGVINKFNGIPLALEVATVPTMIYAGIFVYLIIRKKIFSIVDLVTTSLMLFGTIYASVRLYQCRERLKYSDLVTAYAALFGLAFAGLQLFQSRKIAKEELEATRAEYTFEVLDTLQSYIINDPQNRDSIPAIFEEVGTEHEKNYGKWLLEVLKEDEATGTGATGNGREPRFTSRKHHGNRKSRLYDALNYIDSVQLRIDCKAVNKEIIYDSFGIPLQEQIEKILPFVYYFRVMEKTSNQEEVNNGLAECKCKDETMQFFENVLNDYYLKEKDVSCIYNRVQKLRDDLKIVNEKKIKRMDKIWNEMRISDQKNRQRGNEVREIITGVQNNKR